MKTLQKVGGIAALICAGTYILAMGLVATLLTPMLDSALPYDKFIAFYLPHQSLVFVWHFSMYLVNGTCLALLVLALYKRLQPGAPTLALVAACFGLFWTGLVFASGFITLYGWEVIGKLSSSDPSQAALLRLVVYTITTGIDPVHRILLASPVSGFCMAFQHVPGEWDLPGALGIGAVQAATARRTDSGTRGRLFRLVLDGAGLCQRLHHPLWLGCHRQALIL